MFCCRLKMSLLLLATVWTTLAIIADGKCVLRYGRWVGEWVGARRDAQLYVRTCVGGREPSSLATSQGILVFSL